jgi:hypothetical protein
MSQFLEMLKTRLADAQTRLQLAQVALQKATIEHQAVMQEFSSWQNAVNVESRREMQDQVTQQPQPLARAVPVNVVTQPLASSTHIHHAAVSPEINKSNLIREVLRQHPNGVSPADVWKEVRDHVGRAYVYSVLKRLKDRKQASERRGKYFLLVDVKPEEDKEGQSIVN